METAAEARSELSAAVPVQGGDADTGHGHVPQTCVAAHAHPIVVPVVRATAGVHHERRVERRGEVHRVVRLSLEVGRRRDRLVHPERVAQVHAGVAADAQDVVAGTEQQVAEGDALGPRPTLELLALGSQEAQFPLQPGLRYEPDIPQDR